MNKLYSIGKNVVLKLVKEKEEELKVNGILLPAVKNSTKYYEVVDAPESRIMLMGYKVLIRGYPALVELDGEHYCIVSEDDLIAYVGI
jgi:co-chaperonin GroES (HSP10)